MAVSYDWINEMLRTFDGLGFVQRNIFAEFRGDVLGDLVCDSSFLHSDQVFGYAPAVALTRNRNLFGTVHSKARQLFENNLAYLQPLRSVFFSNAIYIPSTCSVFSPRYGFYEPLMTGFMETSDADKRLLAIDSIFIDSNGYIEPDLKKIATYSDFIAIPICGCSVSNYGHFLFDGLAAAMLLLRSIPSRRIRIVGPHLNAWQLEILELLGVAHLYEVSEGPTAYHAMIVTTMLLNNVAFPNRITRALFDELSFRAGAKSDSVRHLLYVSRRHASSRRNMLNREEVDATFKGWGFEVIYPEELSLVEQIRLFSGAAVVAAESGAALANIGFCQPGCRVLEIQPECFIEGWTRAMCLLFGHEWHVYFAQLIKTHPDGEVSGGKYHDFDFTVDIPELIKAIHCLKNRNFYQLIST